MSDSVSISTNKSFITTWRAVEPGLHAVHLPDRNIEIEFDTDFHLFRVSGPFEQQKEVQGAAAEPGPEDPLQTCDCQTLPVEGSIGGPGPLPDAFPDEIPNVEGVGSDAKDQSLDAALAFCLDESFGDGPTIHNPGARAAGALRQPAPLGGLTGTEAELLTEHAYRGWMLGRSVRPALRGGTAAWASLDKLVADAIAGGATTGSLSVASGEFRASASWKDGVVESAYMSKIRPDREP